MNSLEKNIDSKFRLCILAAKRAKQLVNGARKKIDIKAENPLTVAIEEIEAGQINFHILSEEEEKNFARREILEEELEAENLGLAFFNLGAPRDDDDDEEEEERPAKKRYTAVVDEDDEDEDADEPEEEDEEDEDVDEDEDEDDEDEEDDESDDDDLDEDDEEDEQYRDDYDDDDFSYEDDDEE